jgi:hypothetical protein
VKKADWFEPELNPKVRSFGEHYDLAFWPTRPYTPRHKGKVEKGVDYVQDNALKGRRFTSLEEENRFLLDWELTVADTRIHGTTRRQVGKHFADVERAALLPLPLEPFPSFQEGRRTVHRDGHVEVKRAYYAVPPEYLAREVSELLIWGRSSLVGCDVICLRPRYFDNPWWEGSGSEAGKRNGTFRDGSNHLAHTRRKVPFPKHYCRSSRTVPRASAIRSALYEKMAIGSISAASSRCSSTLRVTVALFGCLLLN